MKKITTAAFSLALFLPQILFAQKDSSGVYLTGEDFQQRKLSYAINCNTEQHKIKLNDFFGKSYITVKHFDSSYKLNKNQIFGYKTCDGEIVRFLEKKELVLLNADETILIYRHEVSKPGKGQTNVTNYYFSKDALSPAQSLTIKNVKKAFPDNHAFHMKLDEMFKYNTELAVYDDFHKMYKLNWIFKQNP
ncbi:MAG: hypothetical protein INR73_07695 [Williamsia sp.]|nr:hypothetical protein [Williamsia sp.]